MWFFFAHILQLKPPSSTLVYASLNLYPDNGGSYGIFVGNQGSVVFQTRFRSHVAMTGGVRHKIGAFTSQPDDLAVPLTGIYFNNVPFSNWTCITGNGSSTTQTQTSLPADTNWHA